MGVRMRHPGVEVEYVAQPEQVPHLRETGWQVVEGQSETGEVWPVEVQRFEGQPVVRLRHPDVADEITVASSAVPFHRSQGWQLVDDEAMAEAEDTGEPVDDDLDGKTVAQLQDEIRKLNADRPDDEQLPVSGTKPELLSRVREARTELPAAQTSEPPAAPADEEE